MKIIKSAYKIRNKNTGKFFNSLNLTYSWALSDYIRKIRWHEVGKTYARYDTALKKVYHFFDKNNSLINSELTIDDIEIIEISIIQTETPLGKNKFLEDLDTIKKKIFLSGKISKEALDTIDTSAEKFIQRKTPYTIFWNNKIGRKRFGDAIDILHDCGLEHNKDYSAMYPAIGFADSSHISLLLLSYDRKNCDKLFTINLEYYLTKDYKTFIRSFNNV